MEGAVEMEAMAGAHPASSQPYFGTDIPIRTKAEELKSSVEEALGSDLLEAAWKRGLAADFDSVVAGLIEAVSGG